MYLNTDLGKVRGEPRFYLGDAHRGWNTCTPHFTQDPVSARSSAVKAMKAFIHQ